MKPDFVEQIVRTVALEAIKEYRRVEREEMKVKIFRNTRTLMENYNRIRKSAEEGEAEAERSDIKNAGKPEEIPAGDIFINCILKSKLQSAVMIARIDKCLRMLEDEECRKKTPEKYLAFKYYYLDEMKQESIAEMLGGTDRTVRRWMTELTNILSIYLFGADAVMLE